MDTNEPHFSEASEKTASSAQNRWTSFSLLTILLLLTIVALGISHVRMSWDLDENNKAMATMEAELNKLRKETGYIDIQDESLVHVVTAPTHEDLIWRWKVFIPDGVTMRSMMRAKYLTGGSITSGSRLESGENQIELAIYRGPKGHWKQKITIVNGPSKSSSSGTLPEEYMSWFNNATTSTSGLTRTDGTKTFQPDEDIKLLTMTARPNKKRDPESGSSTGKQPDESTEITAWMTLVEKP
ncbi:hypothetical protein [Bremerella alba]|uniref:Uncharacterized protein n=1 Tax=Bremerella alba TaxID=980252 RepID=A0A7V8V316_9BACT|nr:hypothetical protein [Bremerella alba]MBA2113876.1 hypothetical protein [Bremerella alba]